MDLSNSIIALLGGDGRELECARQAAAEGATVRVCGLPPAAAQLEGIACCSSVEEAVEGAHIVICPIPLPHPDGSLYAPHAASPLTPDRISLAGLASGAILITGEASPQMREAARQLGFTLKEYEADEELMVLRSPAIAEGAIRVAIEHTEITLHKHRCVILGYGKIGPALARTLLGLGARVTVVARNAVQRSRAWELGCEAVPLEELTASARGALVIFNIASAPLLKREVLEALDPQTLLVDLAAPPGGVDFEAARSLGFQVIWARGLGGRAPRTVGQIQWMGIRRLLEDGDWRG